MKQILWVACAFAVIGWPAFGAASVPSTTTPPICTPPSASHIASLAAAADVIECNASSHRLLIVGEMHGTKETPELVGLLVQKAAASRPVRLGLEMPSTGQAALELFLHSAGRAEDQAKLLQSPFWNGSDGRSSMAMLQLIDHVRALRSAGADVDIFAMEPTYSAEVIKKHEFMVVKEAGMAQSIRRVLDAGTPNQWVIALMGNVHSRIGEALPGLSIPTPSVTERLADTKPYVVLPTSRQMAAWNCTSDGCGVHDFTSTKAPKTELPAFVTIKAPATVPVIRLWMGTMTAALPAKLRPAAATPPAPPAH